MQVDRVFTEEDYEKLNPTNAKSIDLAMKFIKNPLRACIHVFDLIQQLTALIKQKNDEDKGERHRLLPLRNFTRIQAEIPPSNMRSTVIPLQIFGDSLACSPYLVGCIVHHMPTLRRGISFDSRNIVPRRVLGFDAAALGEIRKRFQDKTR